MQNLDDRPTWRVTRAGVAYVFGLTAAAVTDLENRSVLVFEHDEQIDLADAAARIFAEGRLLQINALDKVLAVSNLVTELTHRINTMFDVLSDPGAMQDNMLAVVTETVQEYQRIVDDMTAVLLTPMGSPVRPALEEGSSCALN